MNAARDARQKWVERLGGGVPIDAEKLFPVPQGLFANLRNKRRTKLLTALAPTLQRALEPGETVHYAARGNRYFAVEYFFTGVAVAMHGNQAALVLTDRRLIVLQVNSKNRVLDLKHQVRLSEIQATKKRFGSSWEILLKDGKKLSFLSLTAEDRKTLGSLLPNLPKQAPTPTASLEHLCPGCLKVVAGTPDTVRECPHQDCRIPFRSPRKAAKLSALVPGVGDLYLRHYLFGTMEFVGSMVALALGAFVVMLALAEDDPAGLIGAAVVLGFMIFAPRVIDYFLTLHMGRKGFVPLALKPAGSVGADALPAFPGWSYALFGLGVLGLLGSVVAGFPLAQGEAQANRAENAARAGDFEQARALWEQTPESARGNDAIASLADAFYEGGDLVAGDELVAQLEGKTVSDEIANRINRRIAKLTEANEQYRAGLSELIGGGQGGWAKVDLALATYAGIKRPRLPQNRGEVAVTLAADMLDGEHEATAVEALLATPGLALPELESKQLAARLALVKGEAEKARALIAALPEGEREPRWAIFELGTRFGAAQSPEEVAQIQEQLAELEISEEDADSEGRREELRQMMAEDVP
jgi:hypothetical protein